MIAVIILHMAMELINKYSYKITLLGLRELCSKKSSLFYSEFPQKSLHYAHHAYILPILDYCDVVCSPYSALYTRRLERVHSRFVSSLTSSDSDLKQSLTERRTFHTAVKVFKILHKLAPPYLHGMFQYASAVSGHTRRNPLRLLVPSIRTNYGRGSLWFHGTTIWNNLSLL